MPEELSFLAGMAGKAVTIIVLILGGLIALGLLGLGAWWFKRWYRWRQYKVVVMEVDSTGTLIRQRSDWAGVFVDSKTKHKRFFIKGGNVSLNADDVPIVPGTNKVYVVRHGRDHRFLRFNRLRPTDVRLEIGEDDVNWGIETYERQKKMFDKARFLQYMPYIMMGFTTVIILIIFIYFFKDFAVLKEVAVSLKEAAHEIAQAKAGTVIVD